MTNPRLWLAALALGASAYFASGHNEARYWQARAADLRVVRTPVPEIPPLPSNVAVPAELNFQKRMQVFLSGKLPEPMRMLSD